MIAVLSGVSGSGKTTVGRLLAQALSWPYIEGDDLHPAANIEKMSKGVPLTDYDRQSWLVELSRVFAEYLHGEKSAVASCSALKRSYRDRLRAAGPGVVFVQLSTTPEIIRLRLTTRQAHFAGVGLMASQFAALEPLDSDEGMIIEASTDPADIVLTIRQRWAL
ncbi:gluconokinase [Methylococcus sp. EFPC2]|uniref:gluconokinase n=1 Tax=Methylococcus sp. EFPC2 TaxID=2812648 RepID=UPI001F07EB7D|nr:gluconokinase [Methylococcus sp. EFPC2]